jgi:hypothetical protein
MEGSRRVLACLALGLWACNGSEKDPTLAQVDEPVRAELVRIDPALVKVECGADDKTGVCAPGVQQQTPVALRVHHDPRIVVPIVHCTDLKGPFEVSVAADGRRFAYRCTTDDWYVVFAGAQGHTFQLPKSVWKGGILKWRAVPTFAESTKELFLAADSRQQTQVLEEIETSLGEPTLAGFLADMADSEVKGGPEEIRTGAAWAAAFGRLSQHWRAEVAGAITREALGAREDAVDALLTRATIHGLLGDPKRADALRGRIEGLLGPTKKPSSPLLRELLRALVLAKPMLAGSIGCRIIDEMVGGRWQGRGDKGALASIALWAVAEARHPCRAVTQLLVSEACHPDLRCSSAAGKKAAGPLCSAEETAGDFDALRRSADYTALLPDAGDTPIPARLALAAAHRMGDLDPAIASAAGACSAR